jgi:hypothetical protein
MVALVLAAGCGGPDTQVEDMPDAEAPLVAEGEHLPFVIDSIRLPTSSPEARDLGHDLDDDGEVDNQLGAIVSLLSSKGADLNANVAAQVDRGNLIHLVDVQATDLTAATNVGVYVWTGANPQPSPCLDELDEICRRHLGGNGSFDVTSESPEEAMIFGEIVAGRFSGGRGTIELEVPIFVSDAALHLELVGARIEAEVSANGLTEGRLAGAVPADYMESSVMPQLEEIIGIVVERDCTGTAPSCCLADTDGATAIELFDTDDSCSVTLAELEGSALLDTLLASDVDILDGKGLQHPDGQEDSLSLGVAFTAVRATYAIPDLP